ncbi:proprotein convertase subtilisin/kexin type 5-like isoform X2 [Stylophora pistillata]|uniref:proprotein convertase subtilisin/kexin type 5-like isoform X2 n=1 Tax=Stylophora pistillata TaxID=50429 RepID=UPI000C039D95|nr:proprotein convertase subtilisin/kexin type 5-like isoform X2 [Stylophora pistillata]
MPKHEKRQTGLVGQGSEIPKTNQNHQEFGAFRGFHRIVMKKTFLVLLGIAIVLLATAEGRRGRKRGGKGKGGFSRPNKKACTKNCNICDREGTCLECDDGFAKVTFPKRSKTVCVPCSKRGKKTALNGDMSKCPPVTTTDPSLSCPQKCSSCKNGACLVCESGFALVTGRKNKTACISCATGRNGKRIDKSQCGSESCGKNCLTCTNGTCTECANGFQLNQDKNMCKKIKDCGKGCKTCVSGVCSGCNEGLVLGRKSRRCVKACSRADPNYKSQACEGKRNEKGRKKKRKGGKGKPKRKRRPNPTQPTAEPH